MALRLDDIRTLFDRHGDIAYSGEPVTQREHALQTAALAEAAGALVTPRCCTTSATC